MDTAQRSNDQDQEQEKEQMEQLQLEDEDQHKNNANFFLSKRPKPPTTVSEEVKSSYIDAIRKVFNHSPLLEVEVINSNTIEKGTILSINPYGLENSLRNAKDGYTYFGFEHLSDKSIAYSSTIDYCIKPKEVNYEDRYIGLHFRILFNPLDLKYYISDLGYGFGTFKKITAEADIDDNSLINIGNSYLVFNYKHEEHTLNEQSCNSMKSLSLDKGDETCLHVKVFSGNAKYEPFVFHHLLKKTVYIGRDTECNVMIDDSLLSRFHCTLEYRSSGKWAIRDGKIKGRDIKLSTNGTWVYLMENTVIEHEMIFKGNQNVFKCSYSKKLVQ